MPPKIRKKVKKTGAKKEFAVVRKVRLPRDVALQLNTLARGGDLTAAERHLRMLRPELAPHVIHEVAFRCADPQTAGGIETGHDPAIGDYADVAITK
jgi:hypothetical protein